MPTVLGLSVEANLAPTLDAVQARLGLSDAELQAEYDKKQAPFIAKRTEFLKGKADKESELD